MAKDAKSFITCINNTPMRVVVMEDVEGCVGLTCGGLDRRHLTSLLRREAAGGPTALRAMGGSCL